MVLTQVVLSHSGRMLFVGTSSGAVRSVKFPLSDTGEWQEHQAHAASVSRVRGGGEGREGGRGGGREECEGGRGGGM